MGRQFFAGGLAFAGALATALGAVMVRAQGPLSPTVPTTPGTSTAGVVGPGVHPVAPKPSAPLAGAAGSIAAPSTASSAGPSAPSSPAASSAPMHPETKSVSAAGDPSLTSKAAVEKPKPNVFTLAKLLDLADQRAPQLKMSVDRFEQAHAQLDEIRWIPWSQWSASGGVAMVPEIRGTSVYSPNGDISISSKLGPAWRVGVEGVLPLYTFGKIEHSSAAAKAFMDVALADVQRTKNVLHHDVRRAYFGLQLAHDGRYLLEFARDKLTDAVKKAEGDEDMDEPDLLRMKTYQMEVLARLGEVEKGERMALAALRFLAGVEAPAPLDIPEESITPPKKPLVDVLVYLNSAKLHRPEVAQVKSGLEGRTHQVEYAKARMYPDIGLGLYFGYASAPVITDQTNAFVVDNANYLRYGFGLVFRWNLDVLPGSARVRYAQAQLAEMRDTESFALGGVGVEVENAYAFAKDAQTREKFYGEAEALAKKWVASITASIAVGTREDRDIIDPLRSYLTNRYNHLQAIMDLDVAYSQLSLATADESICEF